MRSLIVSLLTLCVVFSQASTAEACRWRTVSSNAPCHPIYPPCHPIYPPCYPCHPCGEVIAISAVVIIYAPDGAKVSGGGKSGSVQCGYYAYCTDTIRLDAKEPLKVTIKVEFGGKSAEKEFALKANDTVTWKPELK